MFKVKRCPLETAAGRATPRLPSTGSQPFLVVFPQCFSPRDTQPDSFPGALSGSESVWFPASSRRVRLALGLGERADWGWCFHPSPCPDSLCCHPGRLPLNLWTHQWPLHLCPCPSSHSHLSRLSLAAQRGRSTSLSSPSPPPAPRDSVLAHHERYKLDQSTSFFVSLFGHTHGMLKFLGPGIEPSHSSDKKECYQGTLTFRILKCQKKTSKFCLLTVSCTAIYSLKIKYLDCLHVLQVKQV